MQFTKIIISSLDANPVTEHMPIMFHPELKRLARLNISGGDGEFLSRNFKSAQRNVCAICKQKCDTGRKLAIDHDHSTNEIREFLCMRCNTIIGRSEENIELLEQIIEYIKRHSVENKLRAV